MVKKTKLFGLPKFGSLRGSTLASLKIGEILAIWKKIGKVLKLEVALILRYLLTDLLPIQTKSALVWPGPMFRRNVGLCFEETYFNASEKILQFRSVL